MGNKRYAIVRVDNKSDNNCKNCEMLYTNDNENNDCRLRIGATFLCDRYGDTKEQLIAKVRQVLEREIQQKHIEVEFDNGFILSLTTKGLAKEIVEFLGVEE